MYKTLWCLKKPGDMRPCSYNKKGTLPKPNFINMVLCFIKYLKTNCMLGRKHLLIVDGHKSHLYNLPFYELMRANDIEVLTIPPHTSHLLQPLDSAPFGAFKVNWESQLRKYNNEHHGHPLNKVNFWDGFCTNLECINDTQKHNGWVQEGQVCHHSTLGPYP